MGEATAIKRVEEPVVVKQESPFEQVEKTIDALARRAYEIFDGNGRIFGRDLDNWLQAERELLAKSSKKPAGRRKSQPVEVPVS